MISAVRHLYADLLAQSAEAKRRRRRRRATSHWSRRAIESPPPTKVRAESTSERSKRAHGADAAANERLPSPRDRTTTPDRGALHAHIATEQNAHRSCSTVETERTGSRSRSGSAHRRSKPVVRSFPSELASAFFLLLSVRLCSRRA